MKTFVAVFLAFFAISALAGPRVIDGDTVDTGVVVAEGLKPLHIRIIGIDTPELRGKCQKEKDLALAAKAFLAFTLEKEPVVYKLSGWDKYGGRAVGDIIIHGVSISEEMIRRGYAVPYTGQGKKKNWCE